jgi:hypothetical protein
MSAVAHGRRSALRVGFAATLASLTVPSMAAAGSAADAELLLLCGEYHSAKDELDALEAAPIASWENSATEAASDAAISRINEAMEAVGRLAAQTAVGVKAKASIIERELPYAVDVFALSAESPEIKLIMSLMADITGGAA